MILQKECILKYILAYFHYKKIVRYVSHLNTTALFTAFAPQSHRQDPVSSGRQTGVFLWRWGAGRAAYSFQHAVKVLEVGEETSGSQGSRGGGRGGLGLRSRGTARLHSPSGKQRRGTAAAAAAAAPERGGAAAPPRAAPAGECARAGAGEELRRRARSAHRRVLGDPRDSRVAASPGTSSSALSLGRS